MDHRPDAGVVDSAKVSTLYPAGLEEILRRILDHEKNLRSAGAPPVDGGPGNQPTP